VALYDATQPSKTWYYYDHATSALRAMANADKFFEIELIRNESLSPKPPAEAPDPAPAPPLLLAYTMRIRWPSFLPGPGGTAVQVGANPSGGAVTFDHSKKQVLFFTGTISR
jgi:hypothetical protein